MRGSVRRTTLLTLFLGMVFIVIMSISCGDNTELIPNVPVDFTINVTNTQYIELNTVGGWIYLTGGYRGILIYRSSVDEFMAYDRACTYDFELECARIEMESSGIIAVDSCCGSRFIITDGSPLVEGPAYIALKRYQNYFDGEYLHVWN